MLFVDGFAPCARNHLPADSNSKLRLDLSANSGEASVEASGGQRQEIRAERKASEKRESLHRFGF